MKNFISFTLSFIIITFLFSQNSLSAQEKPVSDSQLSSNNKPDQSQADSESSKNPIKSLKKYDVDIFPVPIIDVNPTEGETFGLMPLAIFADKETEAIKALIGVLGQYNSTTKGGGGAMIHLLPSKDQSIKLFGEMSQRYYRELSFQFSDPYLFDDFYIDFDFTYLKTPFRRFYGLGKKTHEDDESNFTSRNFSVDLEAGYYLLKNFRINYLFGFNTTDLLDKALDDVSDTLDRYGHLEQVKDSTNFTHGTSLVFDSRKDGEYSRYGTKAAGSFYFSNEALASDNNFQAFNFELIQLHSWWKEKTTTAFRFFFQQIYGHDTPFYQMSQLGGENELRAFASERFVDRGKIIFQVEQRIKLGRPKLFGKSFDVYLDPFFEVGQVFNDADQLGFNRWQPVGGFGLRTFVPPNVIGRLDFGIGTEGFEIYTEFGYPF